MLAVSGENQIALIVINRSQADPQVLSRQSFFNSIRPFDDQGAASHERIDIQVFSFLRTAQAVTVEVVKTLTLWATVKVDNDEGRTGDLIERAPTGGDALHKSRLAGPQIANQANHITWGKQSAQTHTHAAGLLWAPADHFDGMSVEDRHVWSIIRREALCGKRPA